MRELYSWEKDWKGDRVSGYGCEWCKNWDNPEWWKQRMKPLLTYIPEIIEG